MENQQVIIITTTKKLRKLLLELGYGEKKEKLKSEPERISVTNAAEFAGMSIPTFNRRVRNGIFQKHGTGRKVFFLKHEINEALNNSKL